MSKNWTFWRRKTLRNIKNCQMHWQLPIPLHLSMQCKPNFTRKSNNKTSLRSQNSRDTRVFFSKIYPEKTESGSTWVILTTSCKIKLSIFKKISVIPWYAPHTEKIKFKIKLNERCFEFFPCLPIDKVTY